jgi:hypothetical protein
LLYPAAYLASPTSRLKGLTGFMRSSMTATGPCSWSSAVPLSPIPEMGIIGATAIDFPPQLSQVRVTQFSSRGGLAR